MEQGDQGNNHRALEIYPVKPRPGRPRKHPRPNADREQNAVRRIQNLQRQENAPNPPGFADVNENQRRQVNTNDIAAGQVVHGIVDASFNGGCLVTIRVGNCDYTLRGVVFKTEEDVPVGAGNDNSMVRRNDEVPIPADNLNQIVVYNPQPMERNQEHVNSNSNRIAKLPVSRARYIPPVPVLPNNDNVLPVLPTASLEAFIGKHTNQVDTVGDQVLSLSPTSNPGMSNSVSAESLYHAASDTVKLPYPPCENLPTEDPSQPVKTDQIINAKIQNKEIDQPIFVQPQQTILPDLNTPAYPPESFENF